MTRLSERLEGARTEREEYARKYGLDFYDTIFEAVSPREMLVAAAREMVLSNVRAVEQAGLRPAPRSLPPQGL